MRVEALSGTGPGSREWQEFVARWGRGRLGDAPEWPEVMREAYGVEPHSLCVRDEAGLRGVLPLVRVPTLRGGAELVSMPYLDGGGILARDAETSEALLAAACGRARECGAAALELRQNDPLPGHVGDPGLDRVGLVLALGEDEETLWKALPAKVRNQTRKASREGLTPGLGGEALLDAFFDVFRVNMRDLGTPVHGRGFYRAAARHFGERLRFVVALDGERPVGGLVAIQTGQRVTVPWAATLRAERWRCPNNLLYWEALRWAVGRGARIFDFGRSPKESGTWRFKRGWGAEEEALHWLRFAPDGSRLPIRPASASPLLRGLSRVWTRLPLPLADRLGPTLRRRLPS